VVVVVPCAASPGFPDKQTYAARIAMPRIHMLTACAQLIHTLSQMYLHIEG